MIQQFLVDRNYWDGTPSLLMVLRFEFLALNSYIVAYSTLCGSSLCGEAQSFQSLLLDGVNGSAACILHLVPANSLRLKHSLIGCMQELI